MQLNLAKKVATEDEAISSPYIRGLPSFPEIVSTRSACKENSQYSRPCSIDGQEMAHPRRCS
jgi:deoxyinosine 3'endonuclease (endonuclease V)